MVVAWDSHNPLSKVDTFEREWIPPTLPILVSQVTPSVAASPASLYTMLGICFQNPVKSRQFSIPEAQAPLFPVPFKYVSFLCKIYLPQEAQAVYRDQWWVNSPWLNSEPAPLLQGFFQTSKEKKKGLHVLREFFFHLTVLASVCRWCHVHVLYCIAFMSIAEKWGTVFVYWMQVNITAIWSRVQRSRVHKEKYKEK